MNSTAPSSLTRPDAPPDPPRLTDWRTTWALVKGAVSAWIDDYAPSMGAALAYYTFFSLAPLLIIVVAVAGFFFGAEAARGQLFGELSGLVGADAASSIESLLAAASRPTGEGLWATLLSGLAVLIGATTVFGELQDSLDRIWRAPARDKSGGILGLLRARVLSFGLILALAFLLVVSLVVSAALAAVGAWWDSAFVGWEVLAQLLNLLIGFAVTTVIFALIYKVMPRVRVAWRDVLVGALVTSMLFSIGRVLIGLYIGKAGLASPFGAAGSLVVVLLWVYYSAQVFLLGAEFTWVYARTLGSQRQIADPQAARAAVAAAPAAVIAAATAGITPDIPQRPPAGTAHEGSATMVSETSAAAGPRSLVQNNGALIVVSAVAGSLLTIAARQWWAKRLGETSANARRSTPSSGWRL